MRLRLHRLALRLLVLRYGRRTRRPAPDGPVAVGAPVTMVLLNAFGMGGATRSVFNVAGELAATRPVEVVSIVAGRDAVLEFPFPDGCTLSVLDDRRRRRGPVTSFVVRALGRLPTVLMHPHDDAVQGGRFSLLTDLLLLRRLRAVREGSVLTSRPAVSLLAAVVLRPHVALVIQEHTHYGALRGDVPRAVQESYGSADVVCLLTDGDREQYATVLSGPRIVAIPNAVSRLAGRPLPARSRRQVVVAAGRLTEQKGFDLLIDAFGEVHRRRPDWRLEIHGRGRLRGALAARIDGAGLAGVARMAGPTQQLGEVLASSAVYVLSSRYEGMPLVLLEAMSKGSAVIAFDCPTGPRELLTDGHDGLLLPPGDVPALSAALLRVTADADLRGAVGAAALETAGRYSLDLVGQRWRDLFDGLADRPWSSRPGRHDPVGAGVRRARRAGAGVAPG